MLGQAAPSLAEKRAETRSLKPAAAGLFEIGVGISDRIPERRGDWDLLLAHFGTVTPENCMKPAHVQPAEGEFDFDQADAFFEFAEEKGLKVVGHCLVWAKDDRMPAWFFQDGDNPADRELLLDRMRRHIEAVVGRYRGRISAWDVVNEALADGDGYLRSSGWEKACGEEFIAEAFRAAHRADPDALLIYNDYDNELPEKREKMLQLIRSLQEQNVPVHAIGLQGHYQLDSVPLKELEATLGIAWELGLKVVVSELDIDVIPRSRWWADDGRHREELSKLDPYAEGCPPEILEQQAEQYRQLFELFRRRADVIERVSFWNLHDGQSWLNDFPWRRTNHPLLFDREGRSGGENPQGSRPRTRLARRHTLRTTFASKGTTRSAARATGGAAVRRICSVRAFSADRIGLRSARAGGFDLARCNSPRCGVQRLDQRERPG